jgi:hypothetical protein
MTAVEIAADILARAERIAKLEAAGLVILRPRWIEREINLIRAYARQCSGT